MRLLTSGALEVTWVANQLGERYLDERAAAITGFALSDAACLETARQLGLRWLPAATESVDSMCV